MPIPQHTFTTTVLEQCAALRNAGVWLGEPSVRPNAWLANFDEAEQVAASALLDHFVYFSERHCDLLFESAFDALGRTFLAQGVSPADATQAHRTLLDSAFVTRVEGERPNPTDSGNLYCRRARQLIHIPEEHIVDPGKAIEMAAAGHPILFVDDFVGSGAQMTRTWHRPYRSTSPRSFHEAHSSRSFFAAYVCLIATETGRTNLQPLPVRLFAAHILSQRYCLPGFQYPTYLPADISLQVERLLRKYAPLLELDAYMRVDDYPVFGFGRLATAVAFQSSVPDATLPLFWARAGRDWTPLVERR